MKNVNVEGAETVSVDTGLFSCEDNSEFDIDLALAEELLREGRIACFARAKEDRGANDCALVEYSKAPAAMRAAVARSFLIAFAEWLHNERKGIDEYGVGIGWEVSEIVGAADAVADPPSKRARA